ncbi:MAG: hypothetical protein GY870_01615 [archaeon]|nr:hypothetical protein [archaeon]
MAVIKKRAGILLGIIFCLTFTVYLESEIDDPKMIDFVDIPNASLSLYSEDWNITWGGNSNDRGYSIALTDEYVYITGKTSSYALGIADIFIAQYNLDGTMNWNKTFGYSAYDEGNDVAIANDGSVYVVGTVDVGSHDDAILLKYSSSGVYQWNSTWGGVSTEDGFGVLIDSYGYIWMCGTTETYGAGNEDYFIAQYDSSGIQISNGTWGGAGIDWGLEMALDSDENITLCGTTESFGNASFGETDLAVVKFNRTCDVIWNETWGLPNSGDAASGIVVDDNDNIYLAGSTESFSSNWKGLFLKMNSTGHVLKNTTWGGASTYDIFTNLYLDPNNDSMICVVGYSEYYGAGPGEAVVVNYNSLGEELWYKLSDFVVKDGGYDIKISSDSVIYIGGYILNSSGIENAMILKYIEQPPGSFTLYTNTTGVDDNGIFDLSWDTSENVQYYNVYRSSKFISVLNGTETKIESEITSQYIIQNINTNGTYYFVVEAVNSGGGVLSNCITITIGIPTTGGSSSMNAGFQVSGFSTPIILISAILGICLIIHFQGKKKFQLL